ncbi:MAG: aspartate/glutamate racemase family protein [Candidatus Sumerlaeota bacterium]
MTTKIFFIHTVSGLHGMFNDLCEKHMEGNYITRHISDESLIQRALKVGGLTPVLYKHLCNYVCSAEEAGADIIQVTCSSYSPAVDVAAKLVDVPVLKIDKPIAETVVSKHEKIGVIATASSTFGPSTDIVRDTACEMELDREIVPVFCEGAYEAMFAGDQKTHDRIVTENLKDLMQKVDAIILAQASMARVAEQMPDEEKIVPLYTSPEPAIEHLAERVKEIQGGAQ